MAVADADEEDDPDELGDSDGEGEGDQEVNVIPRNCVFRSACMMGREISVLDVVPDPPPPVETIEYSMSVFAVIP